MRRTKNGLVIESYPSFPEEYKKEDIIGINITAEDGTCQGKIIKATCTDNIRNGQKVWKVEAELTDPNIIEVFQSIFGDKVDDNKKSKKKTVSTRKTVRRKHSTR